MVEVFVGFAYDYSSVSPGSDALDEAGRQDSVKTEEKENGKEILVFGPDFEVKNMWMGEYDRGMRKGRVALWEEVGWEKWFLLGELVQGCV
jgi:hypothetical protein